MTDLVWYQLYSRHCARRQPSVVDIDKFPRKMIFESAEAVVQKRPNALNPFACDAADLVIYKPGPEFPKNEKDILELDMPIPQGTTANNPLRVLFPSF